MAEDKPPQPPIGANVPMTLHQRRAAARRTDDLRRSQMERLVLLVGERKSWMLALGICSVLGAMCEASILAISARAATALVNGGGKVNGKFGPFNLDLPVSHLLWVGIGLAIARLLLQLPISYLPARIAGDVQRSMRRKLIDAYTNASWEMQAKDNEGYFQEMMTNQIAQASQGTIQTTALVVAFCTFIILILSAFALNPIAAVAVFLAAVLLFIALRPANQIAVRLSRRLSAAQLEYAGSVGEANRVAEETNVFGVDAAQSARVTAFIDAARTLFVKSGILGRLIPNVYQSLIYIILVVGLLAISSAGVTAFSSLGAVVLLLIRASSYGQSVQSVWVSLRTSLPYVERLQDSLHGYTSHPRSQGESGLDTIRELGFDDVEYYYRSDRPVLNHVSFTITGGETVGIVGPSGAGKSTMVQIMLRLRDPIAGRFQMNGIDVSDIKRDDWHERVAYVPQAPKLLHATVSDNVRFYRDFSDEEIERACKLARVHDEIMSWPAGYQTIVGPRADAVSGGQQQRICLARALVSRPSMLVLDEPTSALDPRSEALIQESLESMRSELTLIIVAHRMSTLTICDRVMVVLDGTINAFDTLPELTARNDYYRFASGISQGLSRGVLADLSGDVQEPT